MFKIANAPCSWGVLEFDPNQTIKFDQVLDEIADTGYVGTELGDWGFMPTEPTALHDELQKRKLAMVGAFVPVRLRDASTHEKGAATAVRTAKLLAQVAALQPGSPPPRLVLSDDNGAEKHRTDKAGRITPADGLSDADWKVFAAGADRIAQAVLDGSGLKTVFHHHSAGFVETPAEIDTLLERTDPTVLGLCLDTGHYTYGGGDALAALKRHGDRVWHVHFKDCAPSHAEIRDGAGKVTGHYPYIEALGHDLFCELGKGECAFPALLDELRRREYRGWIVVEQDIVQGKGDPKASARRNREYLAQLGS